MHIWTPVEDEMLRLIPEPTNSVDRNTVAVMKGEIVGHISFFMEINEQLSANLMKFFRLAYFSTLWNFNMIEPWIYNNSEHLSSLPSAGQSQPFDF